MGRTTKRGRKPKTQSISDEQLSLEDIEEEIDDPTIFEGVLAYAGLQQQYTTKPKDKTMSLKGFEAKIDEFKKQKIYKATPMVMVNTESTTQTTPTVDTPQTVDNKKDVGE